MIGHRSRLLARHDHVDHAVLQHLEAADRDAELLARAQIVERRIGRRFHRSDRLRQLRGDRAIHRRLDPRQRAFGIAHRHAPRRGPASVAHGGGCRPTGTSGCPAPRHCAGSGTGRSRRARPCPPRGARRDEEPVGVRAVLDMAFRARQAPAVGALLRACRDAVQIVSAIRFEKRGRARIVRPRRSVRAARPTHRCRRSAPAPARSSLHRAPPSGGGRSPPSPPSPRPDHRPARHRPPRSAASASRVRPSPPSAVWPRPARRSGS